MKPHTLKKVITKERVRNLLSSIFNNSVNIFIQILLVPFFIKIWGKDNYGEWLLLNTIPSYLSISDFGVNVTTTTQICSLVAKNKYNEAKEMYQSAFSFFILLGAIFIIIYLFIINITEINKSIGIKHATELQVEVSLFFLIANTFISHILGISLGIYRSEGRFDKYQSIMSTIFLCEGLSTLFFLILGSDITSISIGYFLIRLLFIVFIIKNLKVKYTWFNVRLISIKKIIPLIPVSIYYTAYTTGYSFIIQGSSFLVGMNLGPSNLVIFNTTRTFVNSLRSFSSIFYGIFLPEYTVLVSQAKLKQAKGIFFNTLIFTAIFSFILSINYLLIGDWFLKLWTHNKIGIEQPFFVLILASILINTISNCASNVLNATNNLKIVGIYCFLFSLITLSSILFLKLNNISQIALVILIFEATLFFITLNQVNKVLSVNTTI